MGFFMSYELEIKNLQDFLQVNIKGRKTKESVKEATTDICKACVKYKCSKVLIDIRGFEERIKDAIVIFNLASKELPEITRKKINKVAIIDNKDHDNNNRFFENVAVNRGHNVKIFTDEKEAINWL